MSLLELSEKFGRKIIKSDRIEDHGKNTYSKIKKMIVEGDIRQAIDLVDYLQMEGKYLHDLYCDWTYSDLTYIAAKFGEEEVHNMLRYVKSVVDKVSYGKIPTLSTKERVIHYSEVMRAHRTGPREMGDFVVTEEEERYVMEFDPCGSGGRMRMIGEIDKTPPRTGPPTNLGKTSKPYFWSWSKAGVPYYCTHCCIWHEIMPIETQGYPLKVTEYSDDPNEPCKWYFYKRPELIPEEYFVRIGKKKTL